MPKPHRVLAQLSSGSRVDLEHISWNGELDKLPLDTWAIEIVQNDLIESKANGGHIFTSHVERIFIDRITE